MVPKIIFVVAVVIAGMIYFIYANALHVISKRRGLKASWLAWFPLLQLWTLGNIADHYQHTVLGKKSYLRFCVPVLTVCRDVLFCYSVVVMMAQVVAGALSGLSNMFVGSPDVGEISSTFRENAVKADICMAVACALIILQRLAKVLSLYRIYRSCKPEKAWIHALCSILPFVPVVHLHLLCIFDEGMPAAEQFAEENVERAIEVNNSL